MKSQQIGIECTSHSYWVSNCVSIATSSSSIVVYYKCILLVWCTLYKLYHWLYFLWWLKQEIHLQDDFTPGVMSNDVSLDLLFHFWFDKNPNWEPKEFWLWDELARRLLYYISVKTIILYDIIIYILYMMPPLSYHSPHLAIRGFQSRWYQGCPICIKKKFVPRFLEGDE